MRLAKEGVSNLGPWGNKYLAMGAFGLGGTHQALCARRKRLFRLRALIVK